MGDAKMKTRHGEPIKMMDGKNISPIGRWMIPHTTDTQNKITPCYLLQGAAWGLKNTIKKRIFLDNTSCSRLQNYFGRRMGISSVQQSQHIEFLRARGHACGKIWHGRRKASPALCNVTVRQTFSIAQFIVSVVKTWAKTGE
jgi:hypothetical protein